MILIFLLLHGVLLLTLLIQYFIAPNYLEDDEWVTEEARAQFKARSQQIARRCFWLTTCLLPACALYDALTWRQIPTGVWLLIGGAGVSQRVEPLALQAWSARELSAEYLDFHLPQCRSRTAWHHDFFLYGSCVRT